MSVLPGQPVSAAVTNAAFVSKTNLTQQDMVAVLKNNNTTDSSNKDTGAIVIEGGLGVEKNIHAGGTLNTINTTESTSKDTGSIITEGGLGVEKNIHAGGHITSDNSDNAISTTTGSITTPGGISAAKNIYSGGTLVSEGNTNVGADLNVAGDAIVSDDLSVIGDTNVVDLNASGDVVIDGDLTVNGTTTTINTQTLDVEDANININNGGNDVSAEGAGITVERTGTAGSIAYENSLTSKFKIGDLGSESEVIVAAGNQTLSGDKTFSGSLLLDETVDSVLTGSGATLTYTTPYIKVTNAGLISIAMITSPTEGKTLAVTNGTGVLIDLLNDSGATAANRILTGTGSDLMMSADSSVFLTYDSNSSRWRVIGGSSTGGGSGDSIDDNENQSSVDLKNFSFTAIVAANALTIAAKDMTGVDATASSPIKIAFQNSSSTVSTFDIRLVTSAQSIVIPSGATLGHSNGVAQYAYIYWIDNAGSAELAISSTLFQDHSIISTTALSAASDSINVIYSTTARSNVRIRRAGRVLSSQTTAGTWASAMTEISLTEFSKHLIIRSVLSDLKTPVATNNFHALVNNSISLSPGFYELRVSGSFSNGGAPPNYTAYAAGAFQANGADTGTAPTALNSGNISVISQQSQNYGLTSVAFGLSGATEGASPHSSIIIRVFATTTIYVVTFSNQTTSANARIRGHLTVINLDNTIVTT